LGKNGEDLAMDTFLTLVIAVGGIATGIGAIWAAMLARRQAQLTEQSLAKQRRFLKEQNKIARSQAQLTEQSLAQTERSLVEQNERARLSLEYDLLNRLTVRTYDTPHFRSMRRAAAKYLLDNVFEDDGDVVAAERWNSAAMEVCNFLEEVGEMLRLGVLRNIPVWNRFSVLAQAYWFVCKPTIEKLREKEQDPAGYEEFEYLGCVMAKMDRERGVAPFTGVWLRQFFEDEAVIDKESPTTTT
jgi:hypothetical protein